MASTIQTNIASLVSQHNLTKVQNSLKSSFDKLSSGYRINNAADDAAGLAISEAMRHQIRSYVVAERNANDGISMAQTAEAALGELTNLLTRLRELAMQSANGSYSSVERQYMNTEFKTLTKEIDRIQRSSKFNTQSLILNTPTMSTITFQVGLHNVSADQVALSFNGLNLSALINTATVSGSSANGALTALGTIDTALATISTKRAEFGAAMNRFESTIAVIQTMRLNLNAANSRIRDVDVAEETSTLASAQIRAQAATAVLAQANQLPQNVMQLLRG